MERPMRFPIDFNQHCTWHACIGLCQRRATGLSRSEQHRLTYRILEHKYQVVQPILPAANPVSSFVFSYNHLTDIQYSNHPPFNPFNNPKTHYSDDIRNINMRRRINQTSTPQNLIFSPGPCPPKQTPSVKRQDIFVSTPIFLSSEIAYLVTSLVISH